MLTFLGALLALLYKQVILDIYKSQFGNQDNRKDLLKDINDQNSRLSKARELLLSDGIDAADYKVIKAECERKITLLEAKLSSTPKQENIEQVLEKALYNLAHIDERYEKADIKGKRQIIGSIYPEKLEFENNAYRTTRVNDAAMLIFKRDGLLREDKKEQTGDFASLSKEVIPLGLEHAICPYSSIAGKLSTAFSFNSFTTCV